MISTKKMTDDLTFRVSSDVVYIRSETHCGQMSSGEKEDRSGHLLLSLDTRFLQLVLHLLYLLSAFFRHNSYLIGITNKQANKYFICYIKRVAMIHGLFSFLILFIIH